MALVELVRSAAYETTQVCTRCGYLLKGSSNVLRKDGREFRTEWVWCRKCEVSVVDGAREGESRDQTEVRLVALLKRCMKRYRKRDGKEAETTTPTELTAPTCK
jgi:hypothetical protein